MRDFPALKIVLEHITTRQAAEFVADAPANVAATITPQHLHLNRNALFQGGLRPHAYCLPVVKREEHRLAVRHGGGQRLAQILPRHRQRAASRAKPRNRPAAAPASSTRPMRSKAMPRSFDEEGALDRLEAFASLNGPPFYGLPVNEGTVTLERTATEVPDRIGELVPFDAGGRFDWRVAG